MQETLLRKIAQIDSITPQASSLIDFVIVFFPSVVLFVAVEAIP